MDIFDIQASRILADSNIDREAFDLLHDPQDAETTARFHALPVPSSEPEVEPYAIIPGVGKVTPRDIARCTDGLTLLGVAHAVTARRPGIKKAEARASAMIGKLALERLGELLAD